MRENLRETEQKERFKLGNMTGGRSNGYVPDDFFGPGEPVEYKTGTRERYKKDPDKLKVGSISTTRIFNIRCLNERAYAENMHWVITWYIKGEDTPFENWYCAPGWLLGWQEKQREKLLFGKSTRLQELKNASPHLSDILERLIHINDPRISSTYIENNPLCIQFDGTPEGLLRAKEKLEIGVDDEF